MGLGASNKQVLINFGHCLLALSAVGYPYLRFIRLCKTIIQAFRMSSSKDWTSITSSGSLRCSILSWNNQTGFLARILVELNHVSVFHKELKTLLVESRTYNCLVSKYCLTPQGLSPAKYQCVRSNQYHFAVR